MSPKPNPRTCRSRDDTEGKINQSYNEKEMSPSIGRRQKRDSKQVNAPSFTFSSFTSILSNTSKLAAGLGSSFWRGCYPLSLSKEASLRLTSLSMLCARTPRRRLFTFLGWISADPASERLSPPSLSLPGLSLPADTSS